VHHNDKHFARKPVRVGETTYYLSELFAFLGKSGSTYHGFNFLWAAVKSRVDPIDIEVYNLITRYTTSPFNRASYTARRWTWVVLLLLLSFMSVINNKCSK
jgi:hypothetical protein